MSRSVGLAHIIRQPDGTSTGVWGVYMLRSAFQPIFAFGEGGTLSVAAFEGLIRPERNGEAVSPGAFFSSLPASDRMHVETLSRTMHLLNAGACLDRGAAIFVNFDPSLFSDREVTSTVLRDMRLVLHEADIEPERIVCEVTEQKTSSEGALFQFVDSLRDNGFRIAVDDYGAEESGIHRIHSLKPDIVKFDAHWIGRLMNSKPGNALLEAMVSQFRAMGIINLFEGIEEAWQLDVAERCGVDMVQGYVLARPEIAPTGFASFGAARPAQGARWGAQEPVTTRRDAEPLQDMSRPAVSATKAGRTFGRRSS